MITIQKRLYIHNLSKLAHQYNNTTYSSRKIKLVDVKPNTNIKFEVDIKTKKSKFRVRGHVRISKYRKLFKNVSQSNRTEECFVINPNKAGLFEGSFLCGAPNLPVHISRGTNLI